MSDNEIKPKLENDSSEDSESGGENETDTASNVSESKPLTFKDWKSLREAQNKLKDNNSNQNNNTNDASSNNSNNRFGNNFGWNVGPNLQVPQNVFGRSNFGNFGNNSSPQFNISPMGINNYFNNKNNFSNSNSNNSNNSNSFNNNKLFSNYFNKNRLFNNNNNNFNNSFTNNNNSFNNNNNFNNSMFDGRNNCPNGFYNNGNDNFNRQNNLNNGHDNFNRQNNLNNARLPDNFFPSDGNRFRNEKNELLNKKPNIFVPNPKPTDGEKQVPFIPKPSMPQDLGGLTAEEKKQQWKDYREAMKPFKNRSFYNARRVVQRLGKKDQKDLDEKEILRLANAREIMLAHKQQSNFKTANYSKNNEHNDEHRELYVGQKKLQKDWVQGKEPMPCRYQNYGNFGNSSNFNNNGFRGQNDSGNFNESGRKIVGGFMYRDFVSGGIMKGSAQSF